MINSRSKGKRGEYAVIDLIQENLGIKLKRDIEQYRAGDRGDLIAPDGADWPFCIEVKSHSKGFIHKPEWWRQVAKAAAAQGKMPVLFYKFDRLEWRLVLKANTVSFAMGGTLDHSNDILLTMDAGSFFYFAREILNQRGGCVKPLDDVLRNAEGQI